MCQYPSEAALLCFLYGGIAYEGDYSLLLVSVKDTMRRL